MRATISTAIPGAANGCQTQISKANIKKLATLLMEDSKKIKWNSVRSILRTYQPNKKGAPDLDGLLRQTLERACLAPSGKNTIELILQKIRNLSLLDRVQFAGLAVRCENMEALEVIVYDDPSVLFLTPRYDDLDMEEDDSDGEVIPLLHNVCWTQGWSDEIKFLLKVILETRNGNEYSHEGLFHETKEMKTPLMMAMEAGADLDEIVDHLKEEYPTYLKENLIYVAEVISEHSVDMDLLRELISWSEHALLFSTHPRDDSTLLCLACCKHNQEMIRCLCHEYFDYYRSEGSLDTYQSLIRLQNHLVAQNNKGLSPLGDLLLSVGNMDSDFAWECIHECANFFTAREDEYLEDERTTSRPAGRFQFHILHLFLSQKWTELLAKRKCILMLYQFVDRLDIDLCSVDKETGNTLLSIVIEKIANDRSSKNRKLSMEVLDFFVKNPINDANPNTPAMVRDGLGRLPLHLACEHSLPWKTGLGRIVAENMPALELVDPITRLPPFAHCAVGPKSNLDSIYELLRLHPGSIRGTR